MANSSTEQYDFQDCVFFATTGTDKNQVIVFNRDLKSMTFSF